MNIFVNSCSWTTSRKYTPRCWSLLCQKSLSREEDGYPPRSHDCMPEETEFAETYQEAQTDLERREENGHQKRTMMMWKNALDHTWRTRPIEATRKIIDRQPKVMQAVIETRAVGRHTNTRGSFLFTQYVVIFAHETWIVNAYFTKSFSQCNEAHRRK